MANAGAGLPERADAAHDRLKQRSGAWFWMGLILATLIHFPLLAYWPAFHTTVRFGTPVTDIDVLELQPGIEIPPPPAPMPRPAIPIVAATELHLDADITTAPMTWDRTLPIVELRPPPTTAPDQDISRAPVFTPYSVAPRLLNRTQVQRDLTSRYDRLGRIQGSVVMWFFIDEDGAVKNCLVKEPSEFKALNEAALEVAKRMRFSPALDRDKRVPAWVALPIRFVQR